MRNEVLNIDLQQWDKRNSHWNQACRSILLLFGSSHSWRTSGARRFERSGAPTIDN